MMNTAAAAASRRVAPAAPAYTPPNKSPLPVTKNAKMFYASPQKKEVPSTPDLWPENTDTRSVSFPIDMVYTWVDGNDEEWLKIRAKFQPTQKNIPADSLQTCRWRDWDELRLSIDSVNRFAPWIRTIFVIADFQRPYWYDERQPGKVQFIDHSVLFGEFDEHLPTFNSHALEAHLHRIPGLSEHFIYANDDTFLGREVYPLDFFTEDGRCKVFLTSTDLETKESMRKAVVEGGKAATSSAQRSKVKSPIAPEQLPVLPYFTAQVLVNEALDHVFGVAATPRKRLKHQMKALRQSLYQWCWDQEILQMYLFHTSMNRFRSTTDIDPTGLVSHVGLLTQQAVPAAISSVYYGLIDPMQVEKAFHHLSTQRPAPKLYCLNDALVQPSSELIQTIKASFEKHLPHQVAAAQK